MAKKKTAPPLFSVKHDFVSSLDQFIDAAMLLSQAIGTALELGAIDERLAPKIKEKLEAFNKSMMTED